MVVRTAGKKAWSFSPYLERIKNSSSLRVCKVNKDSDYYIFWAVFCMMQFVDTKSQGLVNGTLFFKVLINKWL